MNNLQIKINQAGNKYRCQIILKLAKNILEKENKFYHECGRDEFGLTFRNTV